MPATPDQLHALALEAEQCVEKLATGLASAGADDKAVHSIGQMADALRQIAGMIGQHGAAAEPAASSSPTTDDAIGQHMAARRAAVAAGPPQ